MSECHRSGQKGGTARTHLRQVRTGERSLTTPAGFGAKAGGEGNSNPVPACGQRSPWLQGPCPSCAQALPHRSEVLAAPSASEPHYPHQRLGASSPAGPGAQKATGEALGPFSVRGILAAGVAPAPGWSRCEGRDPKGSGSAGTEPGEQREGWSEMEEMSVPRNGCGGGHRDPTGLSWPGWGQAKPILMVPTERGRSRTPGRAGQRHRDGSKGRL